MQAIVVMIVGGEVTEDGEAAEGRTEFEPSIGEAGEEGGGDGFGIDSGPPMYATFRPLASSVFRNASMNRPTSGSVIGSAFRFIRSWNEPTRIGTIVKGRSPFDVGFRLNDVLLSALSGSGTERYGTPREAFKSMTSGFEW